MTNAMIQFSVDDAVRVQASRICERLGMDLPTYLQMCVVRLVRDDAIPFRASAEEAVEETEPGGFLEAVRAANRIAEKYGIADMTLDEINAEGNIRHFPVVPFVVTPREMLQIMGLDSQ